MVSPTRFGFLPFPLKSLRFEHLIYFFTDQFTDDFAKKVRSEHSLYRSEQVDRYSKAYHHVRRDIKVLYFFLNQAAVLSLIQVEIVDIG